MARVRLLRLCGTTNASQGTATTPRHAQVTAPVLSIVSLIFGRQCEHSHSHPIGSSHPLFTPLTGPVKTFVCVLDVAYMPPEYCIMLKYLLSGHLRRQKAQNGPPDPSDPLTHMRLPAVNVGVNNSNSGLQIDLGPLCITSCTPK